MTISPTIKIYSMKAELLEEIEMIKLVKPYLRFNPGDVVFLNSDIELKTPFTVKTILPLSLDEDYAVTVLNNQNVLENYLLYDTMLKTSE